MRYIVTHIMCNYINSLWPSDATWRSYGDCDAIWRSGSTLVQVIDCCLTAPIHCLNRNWIIKLSTWNAHEGNHYKTKAMSSRGHWVNTLRPKQNGRYYADDIFKWIFLNENDWISLKISLQFVPKGPINNIPALVQTMAWRRPGDKPLSEPMMLSLPTHICVTRPQWVNSLHPRPWLRWICRRAQLICMCVELLW